MYNYLTGEIKITTPAYIVIDVAGVGYEVLTPNPYAYHVGETCCVYVYLHTREDRTELYGFPAEADKALFLKLLSVRGIGPKAALAVMAGGTVEEITTAIRNADAAYLRRFPGIGPKASSQIILDLQGRLVATAAPSSAALPPAVSDVLSALEALGYKSAEIKKLIPLLTEHQDLAPEALLRLALKNI